MATAFRDCVLDRIAFLSKQMSELTKKENPHRSRSAVHVAVIEPLHEILGELELLDALLKRIVKDPHEGTL